MVSGSVTTLWGKVVEEGEEVAEEEVAEEEVGEEDPPVVPNEVCGGVLGAPREEGRPVGLGLQPAALAVRGEGGHHRVHQPRGLGQQVEELVVQLGDGPAQALVPVARPGAGPAHRLLLHPNLVILR